MRLFHMYAELTVVYLGFSGCGWECETEGMTASEGTVSWEEQRRRKDRKKLQRRVGVNLKYPAPPPAAALCPALARKNKHALLYFI